MFCLCFTKLFLHCSTTLCPHLLKQQIDFLHSFGHHRLSVISAARVGLVSTTDNRDGTKTYHFSEEPLPQHGSKLQHHDDAPATGQNSRFPSSDVEKVVHSTTEGSAAALSGTAAVHAEQSSNGAVTHQLGQNSFVPLVESLPQGHGSVRSPLATVGLQNSPIPSIAASPPAAPVNGAIHVFMPPEVTLHTPDDERIRQHQHAGFSDGSHNHGQVWKFNTLARQLCIYGLV